MYFNKSAFNLQHHFGATVLSIFLLTWWQCGVMCEQSVNSIPNEVSVGQKVSSHAINKQQSSFVSSGPPPTGAVPLGGNDEYRATYFYPHSQHTVNWNRDTYADAANDFGYNPQQQQQPAATNQFGAVYAPSYGDSDGYGDDSYGDGGGIGGLGGLGGIAGILGIKGLKGLGILKLFKATIPILAIILPGLLLLPLIFLFFPVPVITVPSGQRSLMGGLNFGEISGKMTTLARSVLESDKCMERISCEMSRVSRGSFIDRTLKRVIPRFESHMPQALRRIARVYMEETSGCNKKYTCYLMDDSSPSKKSTS